MSPSLWRGLGDPGAPLIGHHVAVVAPMAVYDASRQLAKQPYARKLKIRPGEHVAAILLTAFCGGTPSEVDESGGVDLVFNRDTCSSWPFSDCMTAAIEVKSLPGSFRKCEDRAGPGTYHKTTIRTAAMILTEAEDQIIKALTSLARKTASQQSRNIFFVIHRFDGFAIETMDEDAMVAIGHKLPLPRRDLGVETLWVLWHPDLLCMWSTETDRWTDMVFNIIDPDNPDADAQLEYPGLSRLQSAEAIFLREIAFSGSSPWLYRFASES